MEKLIVNPNNEVTDKSTNEKEIVVDLLTDLFNRYIAKSKDIKRIYYKYNHSGKQTITMTYSNNYKVIYKNIPTSMGLLDSNKLLKLIKGGE